MTLGFYCMIDLFYISKKLVITGHKRYYNRKVISNNNLLVHASKYIYIYMTKNKFCISLNDIKIQSICCNHDRVENIVLEIKTYFQNLENPKNFKCM